MVALPGGALMFIEPVFPLAKVFSQHCFWGDEQECGSVCLESEERSMAVSHADSLWSMENEKFPKKAFYQNAVYL